MMRMDDFNLTGRVLSANSPAVLALRSEASKSRCAPTGRPFAATRLQGYAGGRSGERVLSPSSPDGACAPLGSKQVALRFARAPPRRHPQEIIPLKLASFARLITVWEGEK